MILKRDSWMNVILWDSESVGCNDWLYNKCSSQWLIFCGPVILPNILKSIDYWMSHIWIMSQCYVMSDLIIDVDRSDLYYMVRLFRLLMLHLKSSDICLLVFMQVNNFSFTGKVWFRRVCCPATDLRIALWPSAEKELMSWLSAVLPYVVLIVSVPFPFSVWGTLWNLIVSIPDHCLFIYFPTCRYTAFPKDPLFRLFISARK